MEVSQQTKNGPILRHHHITFGHISKGIGITIEEGHLHTYVYHSTVHNSQGGISLGAHKENMYAFPMSIIQP
jgi:hypothetical protein